MRKHLDLAGDEVRIGAAFGAQPHQPGDADHELVAQRFRDGERAGAIRIEDDLHEAFAIPQVDEDDPAVVAATVHPAHQRDRRSEMAAVDASTIVSALQGILQRVLQAVAVRGESGRDGQDGRAAARPRHAALRRRVNFGERTAAGSGAGAGAGCRRRGETTPIEMMYLSASSTDMSSSRTALFGTITK